MSAVKTAGKIIFILLIMAPSIVALVFGIETYLTVYSIIASSNWASLTQAVQLQFVNLGFYAVGAGITGWIGTLTSLYICYKELMEVKKEKKRN